MTPEQKKEYGKRIREARLDMGLTMREVSYGMNLPVQELSRLERGDEAPPVIEVMRDVVVVDATCHRCGDPMKAHPIVGVVFPAYVCTPCRQKEEALDRT